MNFKSNHQGVPDSHLGLETKDTIEITCLLKRFGRLKKFNFEQILSKSESILRAQPNLLRLVSPVVVIGDIHGQFYDLLQILQRYPVPENKLLFLGDYVDRGLFCIETLTLLAALKAQHPKSIYLLRGNHEGRMMTTRYNFRSQCEQKYGTCMYTRILDWFKFLPIAAVVDDKYFCVHAGISPSFNKISNFCSYSKGRHVQIPQNGALCDMLWSDPSLQSCNYWVKNKSRSVSYYFSPNKAKEFLKQNGIKMIIRAHQLQTKGYKFQNDPMTKEKLTLTIFSAPNYCDKFRNKGSVAKIQNGKVHIDVFSEVYHPILLPFEENAFEYTLPIFIESLLKIMTSFVKLDKQKTPENIKKGNSIQKQIQFLWRINCLQSLVQSEQGLQFHDTGDFQRAFFDEEIPDQLSKSGLQICVLDAQHNLLMKNRQVQQGSCFGPKILESTPIAQGFLSLALKGQEMVGVQNVTFPYDPEVQRA